MNYLKLKENIEKAIHAHPMEVEPYNDFFDLCREYEKIDFEVAHEWNHNMRVYIGWALRSAVERADFTAAERFDNLLFRSLLFGAPHFFVITCRPWSTESRWTRSSTSPAVITSRGMWTHTRKSWMENWTSSPFPCRNVQASPSLVSTSPICCLENTLTVLR